MSSIETVGPSGSNDRDDRRIAPDALQGFETRDLTIDHCKSWAIQQGFCVVLHRSSDKTRPRFQCDRGGKSFQLSIPNRQWKTISRKTSCPYALVARPAKDELWYIKVSGGKHKHQLCSAEDMATQSQARARSLQPLLDTIKHQVFTTRPRDLISSLLKDYPDLLVTKKDLCNYRAKLTRKMLQDRTPIQALLDCLKSDGLAHNTQYDDKNPNSKS